METSFINVDGLKINCLYLNQGSINNLVIIHGWGGSIQSWSNYIGQLKGEPVNVLIFDLPGFGESDSPQTPWTVKDYAHFIKKVSSCFGLTKVDILGHSFGGQIAVRFAAEYPGVLNKLFLVGAAVIRPRQSLYKIIVNFCAKIMKILLLGKAQKLREFFYRLIGSVDYGSLTNPVMKQTMKNVLADDLSSVLANLKCPTTIIWGKHDTYTPFKNFLKIKQSMPLAKTYVIEDGRHGLHLTHPQQLKKIVLNNL
ncbi:MAG: alpha/beta hydrolase [Patescibacteria group bacterium]|jgi:pimeloyl-ACP methyl ester carboxylesterase